MSRPVRIPFDLVAPPACDAHVPVLLTAALESAGQWLVDTARRTADWGLLKESRSLAALSAPEVRTQLRRRMNRAVAARRRELGLGAEAHPLTVLGFVAKDGLSGLDDLDLQYSDGQGLHTWHVNHKLEEAGKEGAHRLGAAKSVFAATIGRRIGYVENIARDVQASLGNGRPKTCGVLTFLCDGDHVDVLAYDPIPVLAVHRGEMTPHITRTGLLRWTDHLEAPDRKTFTYFPRSSWLIQVDQVRAARLYAELGPTLVRAGLGTDLMCDLALRRAMGLLRRRHDDDSARLAVNEDCLGV